METDKVKKASTGEAEDPSSPFLILRDLSRRYQVNGNEFYAVRDVDIAFPRAGLIAILGESGSGKSTLLNLIGGLDSPSGGETFVDGVSLKDFSAREIDEFRNLRVGFVFQSYQLVGHENLLQNVLLPLKLAGYKRKEAEEIAYRKLAEVGLKGLEKKKPNELSGGQAQRASIARALAASPDLILADEPTGALDSETSVQVMDLLADLAKDRLVLMVTHNRELASRYAERVVEMRDGRVISDTHPLPCDVLPSPRRREGRHRSLSFFSAVRSGASSILSKFGRSSLTAIACSIGIVGVGLVLATTSGFASYVSTVEAGVASSIPISIAPMIFSVNADKFASTDMEAFPNDDKLHIYNMNQELYVSHQNRFTPEYIQHLKRITDDPSCSAYGHAMSVMLNRKDLDFHFLTKDGANGEHYRRIYQYAWAGDSAYTVNSYTQLPTYVMHELYGDEEKLSSLYDVIYGRYPTKPNEMVLIVDRYNRVEFSTLQNTGLLPQGVQYADLEASDLASIEFSSIVADSEDDEDCKVYRCYRNSDYFQVGKVKPNTFKRATYDNIRYDLFSGKFVADESEKEFTSYVNADLKGVDHPYDLVYHDESLNPIECKIVGVIRPTEQSYLQLMPASIGYLPELTQIMADDYGEGAPGRVLAEQQARNWYVPRLYQEDGKTKRADDGLVLLNERVAPIIRRFMNDFNLEELKDLLTSSYITKLLEGIIYYVGASCVANPDGSLNAPGTTSSISTYLSWSHVFGAEFDTSSVPPLSLEEETARKWLSVLMSRDLFGENGDPNIVECLATLNAYSVITNILVFPSSLSSKDVLKAYLDEWNVGKSDVDRVVYADVMSQVTGGIGAIVTVISGILIVFASISLLVSSVMTAIITYISVIERTKEIGILRACGGKKRDVSMLFESEIGIIGFVAGLVGIGLTYALCWPINSFLKAKFPAYVFTDIAWLNPWSALLLLVVSIALALLSGLIPAWIASKKDPVVCLRSEE